MAEAVGLAASIIAIVEFSAKVGKLCVQYSTAAGNARADITRLQSRLKDLNVCLEAAQRLLDDPKNSKLATSQSLVDSLSACKTELSEVQDRLDPGSARKAMRRFGLRALKWPFDSKEINTVVSNLEHYKQTITLCLQVDQTTILLDVSQRVEDLSLQQRSMASVSRPPCFNVPFDRDQDFVARPDMTAWLREKYSSSTGRMALVGMGGFGKSQVAITFAYSIHDEDSDVNVFWVHASSKPRFEEAYRTIAERMKLPQRDEPSTDILALVRDWLQSDESGPWLMIIDNADDVNLFYPKGTDERLLASFLPKRHNGPILVTSRSLDVAERLTGSHKNIFQVSTMDEAQGLHLIKNKLTVEFEHDAAVQLLQALDYIPLAISQAAAYINRRSPRESVESYLEAFKESDRKRSSLLEVDLGDLRRDETVSNSVITTWQVTFDNIRHERPSAANLLSFMSLFDHKGIPEFPLHYYNGELKHRKDKAVGFEDDLDVLRSYSLVYVTASRDVFELHATVQACTRVWTSSSGKLPQLKSLFIYSMRDNLKHSSFENWPTCQVLLPHLESVIWEEPQREDIEPWATLLYRFARYMIRTGKYEAAENVSKRAITIGLPSLGGEHRTMHRCLSELAAAYRSQRKPDMAEIIDVQLVETSKRIWGEEHELTLNSMNDLALSYTYRRRDAEAEELLIRILTIRTRMQGDKHLDILKVKGNLVLAYMNQYQYDKAIEIGIQVVEGKKTELGTEHPSTLLSMYNLAWIYWEQGELEKAIELQEQVLRNQQQGYGQPSYAGQKHQSSGYQSYNEQSQQSYPGQQYSGHQTHSPQPPPPPYNTYQPPQQPQHHQWPISPVPPSQSVQSPPAAHATYGAATAPDNHSIQSPPTVVAPGAAGHSHPCPTPPQGYDGEMPHPGLPQYANPQDSRPSLPGKEKKSSTFLAAAGGFAAGGAAGYFANERIGEINMTYDICLKEYADESPDKRKAKKHGRTAEDFSTFAHFTAWEVDLECNICDQVISGPYAHCKKRDGGDYDICRDCLAQGEVCKGKGKHNLVKVYHKYYCDVCNLLIKGGFYYCSICNNGDWDTCQKCFDAGNTCRGMEMGGDA
ncbi:kinesin light chain [Fusarium mundagurra]|uniref:Kinesin light chain n=1 Tax=Fusarium mundagurra TaxID=1567541 RepID=A0A8H5Z1H7_9HYPO|nr:kinesin light chain [Fusarium mundagurra]